MIEDAQRFLEQAASAGSMSGRGIARTLAVARTVADLDVNFRSHADILGFADALFEGGAANPLGRDFLHLDSCGEDVRARARKLQNPKTSRRQAVLVAGGTSEERARARAAAIAAGATDSEAFFQTLVDHMVVCRDRRVEVRLSRLSGVWRFTLEKPARNGAEVPMSVSSPLSSG